MPGRRRARGRRSTGSKPVVAWYNTSFGADVAAAATSTADLLLPANLPAGYQSGLTVIRMIVKFALVAQAVNTQVLGALGIFVTPRDGVGLANPNPGTSLVDWYLQAGVSMVPVIDTLSTG